MFLKVTQTIEKYKKARTLQSVCDPTRREPPTHATLARGARAPRAAQKCARPSTRCCLRLACEQTRFLSDASTLLALAARRIADGDRAGARRLEINVVHADASASHHPQTRRSAQHRGVDLHARSDQQSVDVGHLRSRAPPNQAVENRAKLQKRAKKCATHRVQELRLRELAGRLHVEFAVEVGASQLVVAHNSAVA